ncbi:MAG: hypothetical protein M3Q31_05620 [Actinomycetota bacterium]|nr:hypothetical protein [Actinomycetota bacterium]
MYEPETRWSAVLRQGDVFGQVLFPLLGKQGEVRQVNTFGILQGGTAEMASDQAGLPASMRFAAVVSHDCELNEQKDRGFFLAARLESVSRQLRPDELALLRAANDITPHGTEERKALDTFLLEPIPGVFEQPMNINFGTITPFPLTLASQVLQAKRAELRHEHRLFLRQKVAFFFGRNAPDIEDAERLPRADVQPQEGGDANDDA